MPLEYHTSGSCEVIEFGCAFSNTFEALTYYFSLSPYDLFREPTAISLMRECKNRGRYRSRF